MLCDNAAHIGQKIVGWSRRGYHISFRSSQDFSRSEQSWEPESPLPDWGAGKAFWRTITNVTCSIEHYSLEYTQPHEADLDQSFLKTKGSHLPLLAVLMFQHWSQPLLTDMNRTHPHCLCIQVRSAEGWILKQKRRKCDPLHLTKPFVGTRAPRPSLPAFSFTHSHTDAGNVFFWKALKMIPGKRHDPDHAKQDVIVFW